MFPLVRVLLTIRGNKTFHTQATTQPPARFLTAMDAEAGKQGWLKGLVRNYYPQLFSHRVDAQRGSLEDSCRPVLARDPAIIGGVNHGPCMAGGEIRSAARIQGYCQTVPRCRDEDLAM